MKILYTILILTICSCFIDSSFLRAEGANYCHDEEVNQDWENLIAKYPKDFAIHTLHALRIGLCYKVERGDISLDEATEIFERARLALADERARKRLQEEKKNSNEL